MKISLNYVTCTFDTGFIERYILKRDEYQIHDVKKGAKPVDFKNR